MNVSILAINGNQEKRRRNIRNKYWKRAYLQKSRYKYENGSRSNMYNKSRIEEERYYFYKEINLF